MSRPSPLSASCSPLGCRYETGGRHLWLHRSGEGGPAVVFLPGAGLIGLDYLNIHDQISAFATSVIYDRAGTGRSDAIALPRTAAAVADELRTLLGAAGVEPPYLLVGHSLGGAYIRRYAQLFPGEVAGLLFLDPAHEGYASMPGQTLLAQVRQGVAMLPALLNMREFYRPRFEAMFTRWPDAVRERLVDYHLRYWRKSLQEAKNLQTEILDEIRDGGAMPDAPLIVLTAMGIDPFMAAFMPEPYLHELNARKQAFYTDLARSVPLGENRMLEDAGHSTLHTDCPDAVIQAIRDLMQTTRP
jgi:pimeloyl-ACP methyl ester carboxylesterase